ncbi:MAG TPA: L-threonylcarbamoyladenylate synthase [Mycobacteriales bacterium]|jgi:tRNA threonylcarbamoyl adenosine modification protein (Sua5/YciO/YrdC/YwlC family)|nr:L-threonylcarbamoyladenylate synthase [Mycobacteriales bacterium]
MLTQLFDCSRDDERDLGLEAATTALRRGQLVVLPTDTVYGVAADAFTPTAIEALLTAKGRDRTMPVPVLVASQSMLDAVVDQLPEAGRRLADACWPGALTLVVRHTAHLAWDLGDTRGTVAVRMPDHPLVLELIGRTGPLGVSSANRSGHPPATTMLDARLQLGAAVAVYLDGGPCASATPSTIVDVTGDPPRVLRLGGIELPRLRELVPDIAESA